ncbi:MAG TPA: M15 family metallopeptidase [Cellulomonas sp.]
MITAAEGLAGLGQRLAEIRSLVAGQAPAGSASATAGTTNPSGAAFAAALAEALAADGATTGGTSGSGSALLGGSGADAFDSAELGALGLTGAAGSGSGMSVLDLLGLTGASSLGGLGVSGASTVDGSDAAGTTSVAGTSSGALDADGVPVDLARYGNGRIPASALEPVGSTGALMWQPAAEALDHLIAAAKTDGVTIGVTEGYRPYDEQVSLAKSEGLYSQGGLAAKPGTSEHGWGLAADLKLDPSALAWMRTNAARFGFVANVPRESWHWAYQPDGT